MNDLLNQLRQFPPPEVSPELTGRVLNRARSILGSSRARSRARRTDKAFGLLVAALSLVHAVWTVVFMNGLVR